MDNESSTIARVSGMEVQQVYFGMRPGGVVGYGNYEAEQDDEGWRNKGKPPRRASRPSRA